jgi:hypothetical protein
MLHIPPVYRSLIPDGSLSDTVAQLDRYGGSHAPYRWLNHAEIFIRGGYEDDQDLGDVIIYTGEGGRDPDSGKQIADQELTGRNLALAKNSVTGLPVRVVRRVAAGYQYSGLFNVEDYQAKYGKSGYKVYLFR